jgi:hypothetical protein
MHVAATAIAAVPLCAPNADVLLSAPVLEAADDCESILIASAARSVLWYESESIGVDVEFEGVEIEVSSNIGITTE